MTVGVSGRDLMIRYIPVPPVPPERLKMLVEFEIRENMAGGGSDVTSDYRPLNVSGGLSQGIVVLAAVSKNTCLAERYAAAHAAGIAPRSVTPSAVALYRGFIASNAFKAGETTFLLDIGRENTEMAIQKDGDILFARNMTGNAGDKVTAGIDGAFGIGRDRAEAYKKERAKLGLTPPEDGDKRQALVHGALREVGDAIVSAVNSGLRFARIQTKMQQIDFDRLVLSGGGARLAGLQEFLQSRLQKPVVLFDPSAAFDGSGLRGIAAEAFASTPLEMAVATGLAVVDAQRSGFDLALVPPEEAAKREFWGRTIFGYLAGAVALVIAATMVVRARAELVRNRAAREATERQLVSFRERAAGLKQIQVANASTRINLSMLAEEARANLAMVQLLPLQRKACPAGLSLTRMELVPTDQSGRVAVTFGGRGVGIAQPEFLQKLEEFRTALAAERVVRSVTIGEAAGEPGAAGPPARVFTCTVELDPWAEDAPLQVPPTAPALEAEAQPAADAAPADAVPAGTKPPETTPAAEGAAEEDAP
jgi:type IV pilus assembly protein PilM